MTDRPDLDERLLDYAARVITLVESLPNTLAGRRIGDQLLRSGTSVGANYEEARGAESRADFVHKLQVALKELRESNYWLRLIAGPKSFQRVRSRVSSTSPLSYARFCRSPSRLRSGEPMSSELPLLTFAF